MASSIPSCFYCCSSSIPPSSNSRIGSVLSFCGSVVNGFRGISVNKVCLRSRICAKFEKFEGELTRENGEVIGSSSLVSEDGQTGVEEEEEDDSCLPSDLEGAVRQSGQATASFVSSGGMRAIVELLIPQLQFLDDEGAQAELWELSRVFLDTLIEDTECQWKDAAFSFSSLSDRKPVGPEDEIVVMIVPDYQMLEYVERIASNLTDDPPRPLIMWNPRLISEDVGVGFNVRKLRRFFLSTFTTAYSMSPLPSGAVFRCYPGLWKVFYDDKDRPNRYLLATELVSRPDAEDLEVIYGNVEEKTEKGQSLFVQAAGIFSWLNRFMKSI